MVAIIVAVLSNLLTKFLDMYCDLSRRVRVVDVRLHGLWKGERWGRKCWLFELLFTVRVPRGC